MNKFGPTRGEWKFRLVFSLIGLIAIAVAFAYRGVSGLAVAEVVGISGTFFLGSAIWAGWNLWKGR